MLARRVVGAADRHVIIDLVASLPGTCVGVVEPVQPADPDDERVDALVRVLATRHWRELRLDRLCVDLMSSLDAWRAGRESFHAGSRRLLDER
jgi:hypothetical protein